MSATIRCLFADASGLCFMGCFYKSPIFGAALDLSLFFFGLPELEVLTNLATAMGTTICSGVTVASVVNAGVAGGLSGAVTSGRLKGGLMGAAQGVAMAGVAPGLGHALGSAIASETSGQFVAHGFVGGLFNIGQKGGFASGFLAAGVGSLSAPVPLDKFSDGIEMAALGGAASVLGGGKFANGAATAAMSYAAGLATGGPGEEGTGSGRTPKDITNEVDVNGLLDITANNEIISGTVTVHCAAGISNCVALINELTREVNTSVGGYTLSIKFQLGGSDSDILIKGGPVSDDGAASSCCFAPGVGGRQLNVTTTMSVDISKFSPSTGDLAHEFGHFLGLHHEANETNGLMSYSSNRSPRFNADELQRVYNVYQ